MRTLPPSGPLQNGTNDIVQALGRSISGDRVLCIGFSESEVEEYVAPHRPASITCLTNWADHRDAKVAKYPLVVGDLCARTSFTDAAFDAVLMLSVVEHLHDPAAAFAETARLLVPRGKLLMNFGPVWSSAVGHHTYTESTNFLDGTIPTHVHLLEPREAMPNDVAHYTFDTDLLNRVMYEDVLRMMRRDFLLVRFEAFWHDVPRRVLDELRAKFPGYEDFSTYGGLYFLTKLPD